MSNEAGGAAARTVYPRAKRDKRQVIVEQVGDELVIYDLEARKCHTLNETAVRIWRKCDGSNSVAEIARDIQDDSFLDLRQAEDVVWLCVKRLQNASLMEAPLDRQVRTGRGMSRRRLLGGVGGGVLALPVIASILAPTPAHAVSCASCVSLCFSLGFTNACLTNAGECKCNNGDPGACGGNISCL